jgi:hypothetical protein
VRSITNVFLDKRETKAQKLDQDSQKLDQYSLFKKQKEEDSFQVFVKSLNGKKRTIVLSKNMSILLIKRLIQWQDGIHPDDQRLIFNGNNLDDSDIVEKVGIRGDDTICMVLKLRGC